jgi:hypothetical protein
MWRIARPYLIAGLAVSYIVVWLTAWHLSSRSTEAKWLAREVEIAEQTAKRLAEEQKRVREIESKARAELDVIRKQYETRIKEGEDEKRRVLADLRDARRRLSIPAKCPEARRAPEGGASPAAAGGHAAERAELSPEAAEFLVGLASEADEVVRQLQAAQEVIRSYQKACR